MPNSTTASTTPANVARNAISTTRRFRNRIPSTSRVVFGARFACSGPFGYGVMLSTSITSLLVSVSLSPREVAHIGKWDERLDFRQRILRNVDHVSRVQLQIFCQTL